MPRFVVLILFAAFVQPCHAQLEVTGANLKVVKVSKTIVVEEDRTVAVPPFQVSAPKGGFGYIWTLPDGMTATRKGNVLEVESVAKSGCVTVACEYTVVDFKAEKFDTKFLDTKFHVEGSSPTPPTPPLPPVPPPPPVDVIPTPDGARVLVIFERTNGSPLLSKEQKLELNSKALFDFVGSGVLAAEDGTPCYRAWDKDIVGLNNASQWWRDMMARPRSDDRWLIVTNGKRSYAGPLPAGGQILNKIREVLESK